MQEAFLKEIIAWYLIHKRDLPWRKTHDPYFIWLSEIILQQTRVNQGLPYYLQFSEKYPTITAFANAPIDEILRTWQGLGYYSRARNMYATAQIVKDQFAGSFPSTYTELIKLKGIGTYTASAISSFVANEKRAVVDGNVYRVLARYWGILEPINTTKGIKLFDALANDIIKHTTHNGLYNQAIMEFGAMHCKPISPLCKTCPLESSCAALHKGLVDKLPNKLAKTLVKKRDLHYLVLVSDGKIHMKKRSHKDIWEGLYDFKEVAEAEVPAQVSYTSKTYVHKLSHQHLHIRFYLCKEPTDIVNDDDKMFFTWEECTALPKPIIIKQFLDDIKYILP